ncbi:MAG: DUF3696 domain-containing protein [Gemmataceae bacterium]|nr:DUF3696 domain-containing protein [Gemmataceae bacterium]MCI0738530.1 DUF3696 domain-containing protein [Gemmataceae bacterium]
MTKATKRAAGAQSVTKATKRSAATGIAEITVAGFKSISEERTIEIRPLTILAGANSSGKSSMMQPLLLLKQTLETSYDAGPLRLDGPNVKFTQADQLLSRIGRGASLGSFQVGMRLRNGNDGFHIYFRKEHKTGFQIERLDISWAGQEECFWPEMSQADIDKTGIVKGMDLSKLAPEGYSDGQLRILRDRCFIGPAWVANGPDGINFSHGLRPGARWEEIILQIIHLPGLRSSRERSWPVTAVASTYPGTFEQYAASVILHWMEEDETKLNRFNADLRLLNMTTGVSAKRLYATQIELYVGRLRNVMHTRPENQVNIADVGLGVSQILPVLVALHTAQPGQLVYVEQPETHLHPRAQFDLAQVLISAANRGVRVVVETHSSLLLLGVQTKVAENELGPDNVQLHWFKRDREGRTTVWPGHLDEAGRFGDWPEDFDDVALQTQKEYLDTAEKRLFAK